MTGQTLPLRKYGADRASMLQNDSDVTGATAADALNALQDEIDAITDGIGTDGVMGPVSSRDNSPAVFDGVTGKLLRDSSLTFHEVVTLASANVDKPELGGWFDTLATVSDGATVTFDWNAYSFAKVVLGGNRIIALSNASIGQEVALLLYQDGTGARTVTWPVNMYWDKGLAPVLDPTPDGHDLIVLKCIGSNTYGPIWKEVCRSTTAPRAFFFQNPDTSTITLDLRKSAKHAIPSLAGNRTLAVIESNVAQIFELMIKQDATGSRLVTWWGGITWAGGVPTLSTGANKTDHFGFIEIASGNFHGFVIGQDL
jgi:hypothetical protein